jgi:hypothetical protein
MPEDPFVNYGRGTALFVGMIHGVGAETPSQVLLSWLPWEPGEPRSGSFFSYGNGPIASNTAVAVVSAFGFLHAERHFVLYAVIAVMTGVFSTILGLLLLLIEVTSCRRSSAANAPIGITRPAAGKTRRRTTPTSIDQRPSGCHRRRRTSNGRPINRRERRGLPQRRYMRIHMGVCDVGRLCP